MLFFERINLFFKKRWIRFAFLYKVVLGDTFFGGEGIDDEAFLGDEDADAFLGDEDADEVA